MKIQHLAVFLGSMAGAVLIAGGPTVRLGVAEGLGVEARILPRDQRRVSGRPPPAVRIAL